MVRRKYTAEEKEAIIKEALKYNSTAEAARKLGVNYKTLMNWAKKANVYKARYRRYTEEERTFYVEASKKYKSTLEASRALKCRYENLVYWIKKCGEQTKRRLRPVATEEWKKYCVQESMKYKTKVEAAKALDVFPQSLGAWVKKYGGEGEDQG